jgi:hypothetical protein
VVRNPGHYPLNAFYQYAGDADHPEYGVARERLLAAGGRDDMLMPAIRWQTYLYLDEHSLSFGSCGSRARCPAQRALELCDSCLLDEIEAMVFVRRTLPLTSPGRSSSRRTRRATTE